MESMHTNSSMMHYCDLFLMVFYIGSKIQPFYVSCGDSTRTHSFVEYMTLLKNEGNLPKLWISYLEMANVLLVRATCEQNWLLHMSSVRDIIPCCFAYDCINYAGYLPVYYNDMIRLPNDHPEVYQYMEHGGFAAHLSDTSRCAPFSAIEVDLKLK